MAEYGKKTADCGYITRGSYKMLSGATTLLLSFSLALDPYL